MSVARGLSERPGEPGLPLYALDADWREAIGAEFEKPYFRRLAEFLREERAGKDVLPSERETFTAFELTPFARVKVVILGQDPYPGVEIGPDGVERPFGHGLAFSVRPEIRRMPGSLRNVFKKLNQELGVPVPEQGYLGPWAERGVLLLNATLTLERGRANSHEGRPARDANWGLFTDAVIEAVAARRRNIVFILWGAFAQSKAPIVERHADRGHLVIRGAHPSPLSARKFFAGPDYFRLANEKLGADAIDWSLP
jgi:uracil-DNA glycosylase